MGRGVVGRRVVGGAVEGGVGEAVGGGVVAGMTQLFRSAARTIPGLLHSQRKSPGVFTQTCWQPEPAS